MPDASGLGPVVQRAILTGELQRLRAGTGQTQDQVAAALDWSTSKLIRIEGGVVGVSATDLQAMLRHYGLPADDERAGLLTALARDARQRGWWSLYQRDISPGHLRYIGYEAGATSIHGFRLTAIPGLLQTEEYANALVGELVESPADQEVIVEVRMRRQEELFGRDDPPRLEMIVDEAVLRRHVGGRTDPGIMPRQLRHLLDVLDRTHVSLDVVPFAAGAHFGMMGGFKILRFDDARLEDLLFQERAGGSVATGTDREAQVAGHWAAFEKLRRTAVPAERTPAFLQEIIAMMESGSDHRATQATKPLTARRTVWPRTPVGRPKP